MHKIAVRELAYFVYQSGNLTNSNSFNQKAIDGKYLHQIRQSEYDGESQKEYYIAKVIKYQNVEYEIHGYIDGLLESRKQLVLEEIKTTDNNVYEEDFLEKPEHLAQLKIYGYLMLLDEPTKNVELNLLYIERTTLRRRNFKFRSNFQELEAFFFTTLDQYISHLKLIDEIEEKRIITGKNVAFPFSNIRPGQKEMLDFLATNLLTSKYNFILAPTGIGKTMAAIFSAVKKATNPNDKIFYLTAKTSGKNIAVNAVKLLQNKGYLGKAIVLTAKKKICLLNSNVCDTENCPFAKDFFNKLKKATLDILAKENLITEEKILSYAKNYELCSFEFSLHLSLYASIIICDYNYVFDPKAKLIRFFEDSPYNNLILVDEAHNLVSRSQSMYSSSLSIISLLLLRKLLAVEAEDIAKQLTKLVNYIHKTYDILLVNDYYLKKDNDLEIESSLANICSFIEELLENKLDLSNREQVVEIYLELRDYLRISKVFSQAHVFLVKIVGDNLIIYLNCLDASSFISDIVENSTLGITFFSATLYPIEYYKTLLIGTKDFKYLCLPSPFASKNLGLYIARVSTRYKDREYTINYVDDLIKKTILAKPGKYIVFFPSYQYLNQYLAKLSVSDYEVIVQHEGLNELEQEKILEKFNGNQNILGLFVLGGLFAEGIDFIGDKLHGVIIVGVGFPQINLENNILKEYFQSLELNGFDYAYTYPGFNKVIQAAGRVIRTENDKGVVVLIDDRYLTSRYLNIFPEHWQHYQVVKDTFDLEDKLNNFWY